MEEILQYIKEQFGLEIYVGNHGSAYITLSETKKIRISNHISTARPACYLNILFTIDREYVVAFKDTIFVITSLKRIKEYLFDFVSTYKAVDTDMQNYINSLKKENEQLQILAKNLAVNNSIKEKCELQKKELTKLNEVIREKNDLIKDLQKDNIEKQKAIDEAVALIKTLTEDPNSRDLLYSKDTGKTYYIDNFPEDEQELIKECIKNY